MRVEVEVEAEGWRRAMPDAALQADRAATAALIEAGRAGHGSVTILLTDDATVQDLNTRFRGKENPTNVLSFPAVENIQDHLGDVALAYETCVREAREQGKQLAAHLAHLTVHGVLHLLGHDHEEEGAAELMEALEGRAMTTLGFRDPYNRLQPTRPMLYPPVSERWWPAYRAMNRFSFYIGTAISIFVFGVATLAGLGCAGYQLFGLGPACTTSEGSTFVELIIVTGCFSIVWQLAFRAARDFGHL